MHRDYLPGYTGYIPQKMNTYGMTVGEINRRLVSKEKSADVPEDAKRNVYMTATQTKLDTEKDELKYGLHSRESITWIGGSTDKIYPQHIPGTIYRPNPIRLRGPRSWYQI